MQFHELGCGGTLAKLISEGKTVAIVDLTRGELGTRGTPEIRHQEAMNAMKILGVKSRENLNIRDGFVSNTEENQMKLVQIIRKYKPEYVLCNATEDRHPDHAKSAKLVSDACFLSGLIKIETKLNGTPQEAVRPKMVFHYIQWKNLEPDFVIDITGFLDKKIDACMAFKSQFYDPNSKEPSTEISKEGFLDGIAHRAQDMGRLSGVLHAEGFITEKRLALKNFEGIVCK